MIYNYNCEKIFYTNQDMFYIIHICYNQNCFDPDINIMRIRNSLKLLLFTFGNM